MGVVIGVDIGGTKIAAALVDESGRILSSVRLQTRTELGREFVFEQLKGAIGELMEGAKSFGEEVLAVGMGSPGVIDPASGVVIKAAVNLPQWQGISLKQLVEEHFGVKAFVDNDVNVMALGECMFGVAAGLQNIIFIAIGTGIGGGIVIGGKLYHGSRFTAGEVGHITVIPDGPKCPCGNYGCLEALASGPVIARRAEEYMAKGVKTSLRTIAGDGRVTCELVAKVASDGDVLCRRLFEEAGRYIGIAISSLMNAINPDCVVIGGGVAQAGELILSPIRDEVALRALSPVPILQSRFGDSAGQIGAAALAWFYLKAVA
ncbi:MAG: ROK family protein [Armatimonadota bacterium]|nr:ROK family protein [Armatimonadota bacterium]MDW8025059.1 ROK family protein [Armatimonadota bacterium]